MQNKFLRYSLLLIFLFLVACQPQEVAVEVGGDSSAEEVTEGVLQPAVEEEALPEDETSSDEVMEEASSDDEVAENDQAEGYPAPAESEEAVTEAYPEPEDDASTDEVVEETTSESDDSGSEEMAEGDSSLPKLPSLAQASDISAPAPIGGGGGAGPVAEGAALGGAGIAGDVMGSSMLIDPRLMFEGSEFVIAVSYPAGPESLQVIQRIRSQSNLQQAIQLAEENGFSLPIYQEQLPFDMIAEMTINDDGTFAGIPLVAFSADQQITIMDGSLWIDTTNAAQFAPFDPTRTYDEAVMLALTNERLATLNLEFDYEVETNNFGSVMVMPKVDGFKTNQPIMGLFFDYNTNNELFIRSMFMDLYAENGPVGEYPILSAEAAWANLLPGLETGTVQWNFGNGPIPTEPIIIDGVEGDFEEPQSWFVQADTVGERALYGWPTVFNPVADDSPPRIYMNGVWIQAPAEVGMSIATSPQGVFKMIGSTTVDESGNSVYVADSAISIPFDSQLFLQGVVVRDGDNVFVDSENNGRVQLIAPPADLPDGMAVFVDGYQDGAGEDGTPLLDWQYLGEVIEFDEDGPVSIEPLPVDGFGFNDEMLSEITIDSIELGYGISWPQYSEESVDFAPIQSDYLIPIWIFSGTGADGTEISFEIPAVDQAFFQS